MKTAQIIAIIIVLILIIAGIYIFILPKPRTTIQPLSEDQTQTQNQNQENSANNNNQGMKIEILKEGTGDGAKSGDLVTVNYTGTLADGTKFDSSVDPTFKHVTPFQFTLGQNRVIQGWEQGVLGMKVGEKRKLTIPPELAYGSQGAGGIIPPNATLTFEIELLKIN